MTAPSLVGVNSNETPSGTTRSVNVAYPAGTQPGDYVIAWTNVVSTSTLSQSPTDMDIFAPTGWTRHFFLRRSGSAIGVHGMSFLGGVAGSETSMDFTYAHTSGRTCIYSVVVMVYRNIDTDNPFVQSTFSGIAGPASHSWVDFLSESVSETGDFIGFRAQVMAYNSSTLRTVSWDNGWVDVYDQGYVATGSVRPVARAISFKAITGPTTEGGSRGTYSGGAATATSGYVGVVFRGASKKDLSASDASGAATESQSTTATAPPAQDASAAPAVESVSDIGTKVPGDASTAAAVDTGKVTASTPASDTSAAAVDTGKVTASVPTSDTSAPAVESAVVSNTIVDSDTGTSIESVKPIAVNPVNGDTGSGLDAARVTATVTTGDVGTSIETGLGGSEVPASDASGSTAEAQAIRVTAKDTASGVDSATYASTVFGSDSGSGLDSALVIIGDGDTGTGEDRAFKSISGILDTPRLLTVPKDDRRLKVVRENRRIVIAADVRRISIGKELAPRSKMPHKDSRTLGIPAESRVFIAKREE